MKSMTPSSCRNRTKLRCVGMWQQEHQLHLDCDTHTHTDTHTQTHTHTDTHTHTHRHTQCIYKQQSSRTSHRRTDSDRSCRPEPSRSTDLRMLCPGVLQPSPVPMRSLLDLHWPVRSLWPETRPLLHHMEQEMLLHMQEVQRSLDHMEQEVQRSLDHMERLQQQIFREMDRSSQGVLLPISFQDLGRDGSRFALSLDTAAFSPEELSVTQVGRRLRVSGRAERKQEDGRGSASFRSQEFRQEFQLPDGVEPQEVSCSLAGGRLQIQAPRGGRPGDGKERVVPINVTSAPAITAPPPASEGGGSPSSETH